MRFNALLIGILSTLLLAPWVHAKPKPKKKDELVVIHTEFGDMTVLLYEETPLHKANFLRLAKAGLYDSVIWHRVIEEFMVQGGDVTKNPKSEDFELKEIPGEFVKQFHHKKGALAAARKGDGVNPERNSSSCQFYIVQGKKHDEQQLTINEPQLQMGLGELFNNSDYDSIRTQFREISMNYSIDSLKNFAFSLKELVAEKTSFNPIKDISAERVVSYTTVGGSPHLDDAYTVFGEVVAGLEVIDQLASVETGRADKPKKDTYMTMEVIVAKTKKITEEYGYVYPPIEKKK